jgi:hypothetical protein
MGSEVQAKNQQSTPHSTVNNTLVTILKHAVCHPWYVTLCAVCRWDEQNALLIESHERVIKDLTEEAEVKLAVEVLAAQSLRQEKGVLLKEAGEVSQAELLCLRGCNQCLAGAGRHACPSGSSGVPGAAMRGRGLHAQSDKWVMHAYITLRVASRPKGCVVSHTM